MCVLTNLIDAGELLVTHAQIHGITLPGTSAAILWAARGNAAQIESPGQARTDFLQAISDATATIGMPAASLRAGLSRRLRVAQPLVDAQLLLDFAAGNGRKVEDDVRNPIAAVHTAVGDETLTGAQEQAFYKAYEGLTIAMSPITAETLRASQTILPTWESLRNPKAWIGNQRWSFGRFFNFSVFVLVLVGTCVTLSFYKQGATALDRYNVLQGQIVALNQDMQTKLATAKNSKAALDVELKRTPQDIKELNAATKTSQDAAAAAENADALAKSVKAEEESIPDRLVEWAKLPCDANANYVFKLVLCSKADQILLAAPAAGSGSRLVKVEAARTVAARLNDVYLPFLLGWLGAHAFLLRRMSKDISDRCFAPGSAFNHIVRLGLGALAGLASTWLLTGEAVGGAQWKNLPIWALAFVAGYGIELVFAFMDRIINAFTSKGP